MRIYLLCLLFFAGKASFLFSQSATPQDCLGAIPICQQVYTETQSPVGGGEVLEINMDFNCMRVESNSFWYSFTVNQSGDFGFLLTPNNPLDDYDWALFDITTATCEDLYTNPFLIASCNAAGGGDCLGATGATGETSYNNQGFSCNNLPPTTDAGFSPFNDLIPVEEGNTYVLCVSNWSGSTNGYSIDFGLSTGIGIFDETPPFVEDIEVVGDCEIAEINLTFSEFIQCSSFTTSHLTIEGITGNYQMALSSVNCDAGGNFSKTFNLIFTPPITEAGNLALLLDINGIDEVLDLCDNPATEQSFALPLSGLGSISLGPDFSICEGESEVLQAGNPGFDYLWSTGEMGNSISIAQAGIYRVTATTPCGVLTDSVQVMVDTAPPEVDLGPDTLLCPDDQLTFDFPQSGWQYQWQDGNTNQNYTISDEGIYQLSINNSCGSDMDELVVEKLTALQPQMPFDTFLCPNDRLLVDITDPQATYYQWRDGRMEPMREFLEPGNYIVEYGNHCETKTLNFVVRECERCDFYAPNVFSANGDGVNDVFEIYSNCSFEKFEMKIFDRWGGLVFQSNDNSRGWNGKLGGNGKFVDSGIYVWMVKMTVEENGRLQEIVESGSIMLLRQ